MSLCEMDRSSKILLTLASVAAVGALGTLRFANQNRPGAGKGLAVSTSQDKWAKPLVREPGRTPNRLIDSTSPYLLQHAYNPVGWYPWGEEALSKAKEENKPIFLSIGYSACHWCHVMEHESFEDEQVAGILNEHYVPIKVDREERPDLDQVYMTAVQLMTGQGGWPMSVFLTPELRPFFGGTYFPKDDRYGRPGFLRVLDHLRKLYAEDPAQVADAAQKLTEALEHNARMSMAGELPPLDEALLAAADELHAGLDPQWGGFGGAPKFPRPTGLELLLRVHARFGHRRHLDAATLTLDKMALGGIYDHVGGGFARYSTDERWLVPHFEKMLYDNAQLLSSYTQAWQATGKPFYARVARETADFVLRDLTDPATGAFYSTLDADSEGEEGKFYVWSPEEVEGILGPDKAKAFCKLYDVTAGGNFEGRSILNLREPLENRFGDDEIAEIRRDLRKLFEARTERVHPLRDDKVLTSWNALMIGALAQAGFALNEPRYVDAATRAADFVWTALRDGEGRLLHTYREGKAHVEGYLEDYAYLTAALLDLHEATFEEKRLGTAREIADRMIADFWDEENGGFFATSGRDPTVLTRTKELFEGATPSTNGVATYALARLALYTGDQSYAGRADKAVKAFGQAVRKAGSAVANLLFSYETLAGSPPEIALVGTGSPASLAPLLDVLRRRYLPGKALAVSSEGNGASSPLLSGKTPVGGKAAAYVCENYVCKKPVTEPGELEALLKR